MSLRIGLFGGGVVGGGVYDLLQRFTLNQQFSKAHGVNLEIVKICVRSLDKPRDFKVDDSKTKIVTDYQEILSDPSINCVVELIGGTTQAKTIVFEAIRAGKHVVTANKALIASHLDEIQAELNKFPNVRFAYEAAVCGSIPIIHSLQTDFVANNIHKITGIMNGTTNFMLSKMEDEKSEYATVLKEAQALGFAEADPTADVEGHDVQAKIAILAKLAFGQTIPVPQIPTSGISKISKVDFEYAKILKSTIKLLGTATINPETKSLAVYVSATVVSLQNPLSSAKGPGNMVLINSDNMPSSTYSGPGAGRYPTANSVVNDLVRIAQDRTLSPFPLQNVIELNNDYIANFYIRIKCSDGLGIIRAVGEAAEKNGVSIHAILQNPIESHSNLDFVVTTELVQLSKVQGFANDISKMSFSKEYPLYMPILH
eukprot:gene4301-4608_t